MSGQHLQPPSEVRTDGLDQRWWALGLCLVLAAITFAVFGQTAGFEFVNCDDNLYVYENGTVAGGISLKGLAWVFTHAECSLYHPLTMLSLMADYQFHGLNAGGYHFTNVLLHIASVVLLFLVLRQMIWPEGLAPFYPQREKGYPVWTVALSFLSLALVTGGLLAFRRKRPWLLTGWLWYLGMLTPMIGIVSVGVFAHADRMTYLPQIGIYMAFAWLAAEWRANRVVIGGLMAGVLAVLMVCAWKQTAYWKDNETLWTHTLDCTTRNYLANLNLGNTLMAKGSLDEAIVHYQEVVKIMPYYAEGLFDLGNALLQKGNVDEAIIQLQRAVQIDPAFAAGHNNLGNALLQKERVDEAVSQYQQALQLMPDSADFQNNLGGALLKNGRVDEAIACYQQALVLNPGLAVARTNLQNALLRKQSQNEVIGALTRFPMPVSLKMCFVCNGFQANVAVMVIAIMARAAFGETTWKQ